MKKLFSVNVVIAGLFLFSSCDKIFELTKKDISVPDVEFKFDAIEVGTSSEVLRADTYYNFEWTKGISISDFGEDVAKYNSSHIINALCQSASINIFSPNDTAGNVIDLLVVTTGNPPLNFSKSSYTLGTVYAGEDMKSFAQSLIFQALKQEPFEIKITGKTDLPPGEKLQATILLTGISVTVQLIN